MPCAPQRYLANNRNLVREAILAASSVLPVAQSVKELPQARKGTAQVLIAGSYTGDEQAQYDIEIVDTPDTNPLISAPIFAGEGSGSLSDISSSLAAQKITVQLNDDGLPTLSASVDFEGVKITARDEGSTGNDIRIDIDQSGLSFTDTAFSLLSPLTAGSGDPDHALTGPAFDWDTKVLGSDNVIPADAHRVVFGDDISRIYLQYKKFASGAWGYYFVPSIGVDVPAGARVRFVTGGRNVSIGTGTSPSAETFSGIVTDYDLLNAIRTQSALVMVDGVVANDRSPTGQASRELLVRTDAHTDNSSGTGSGAATGFVDTFAGALANTELVTAKAIAVSASDDANAHLGHELWKLSGSVSGDLGTIATGDVYVHPDGLFGLRIPQRLPDNFGNNRGKFHATIEYTSRPENVEPPPLCIGNLALGPAAEDQSVTFTWTKRPSNLCPCDGLPFDPINDTCLGTATDEEGEAVDYSVGALPYAKALMDFASDLAIALSAYQSGYAWSGVPDSSTSGLPGQFGLPSHTAAQGTDNVSISIDDSGGPNEVSGTFPYETVPKPAGFGDEGIPSNFQSLLDAYESALKKIDAVTDTGLSADGFTAWQEALDQLEADLAPSIVSGFSSRLVSFTNTRYLVMLRRAVMYAGVSQSGKSDASSVASGDGCWQDLGDAYYWTVEGTTGGTYAPAFNNHIYYSSRLNPETKLYNSTKEYSVQINCACPGQLKEGDKVILSLTDTGYGATYQVGDTLILPIIAAQALYLAGGQDGNAIQTWNVSGSVVGPLPNFVFDPDSPSPYQDTSPATLAFTYTPGGIASKKGDRFTFSIEGGRYRTRKDGGAWSSPDYIPAGPVALDEGLTLEFVTGSAPSFYAGDQFSFLALQPWAVSNLQSPNGLSWRWAATSPDSVSLVVDMGSAQLVTMLGIAQHTIPEGATITIEGGTAPGVYPESDSVTWNAGAIAHVIDDWTVRYLRLTVQDSGEASIGWLWAGDPFATTLSAEAQRKRSYLVSRSNGGLMQGGRSLAKAAAFDIEWTEGALYEADVEGLADLIDWLKEHDDEPFIFVPQVSRPDEAFLQRIVDDVIEFTEMSGYNRDPAFERRYSARFATTGPWQ